MSTINRIYYWRAFWYYITNNNMATTINIQRGVCIRQSKLHKLLTIMINFRVLIKVKMC
jgi:hypothetical protein